MSENQILKGGCLCGKVRFDAIGQPEKPHTCSCQICQKHSGSLTLFWVEYPASSIKWTANQPALYRSSDFSSRIFCTDCGSTLGAIDDAPVVALTLGAFDKNTDKSLKPNGDFFTDHLPEWLDLGIKNEK